MKQTIYKSIITIEVLSKEPINEMTLVEIVNEGLDGTVSIITNDKIKDKPIKGIKGARELEKHGTDYEFFGMDSKGNVFDD